MISPCAHAGDNTPLELLILNAQAEAAAAAAAAAAKGKRGTGKPAAGRDGGGVDPPGTCRSPGDVAIKIEHQVRLSGGTP